MKKKIAIYIGIILGFLALSYAFVPQVLDGKVINQSDISGWRGMVQEMDQWNKAHPDDKTAWTGSMFGGMPTATIEPSTEGDWTWPLYKGLMAGKRPANWLFVSLLGGFLLMLAFGVNPLIAAGGAIAITFCSFNMQIIQVGHNTKMQAIALMPWVLAAMVFAYRSAVAKKWPKALLGAALFGLSVSFQVKANHPQISYYLAIIILLYALTVFIWLVADKERRAAVGRFFAVSALLVALGVAGIGTNASKLLPTFEYLQEEESILCAGLPHEAADETVRFSQMTNQVKVRPVGGGSGGTVAAEVLQWQAVAFDTAVFDISVRC